MGSRPAPALVAGRGSTGTAHEFSARTGIWQWPSDAIRQEAISDRTCRQTNRYADDAIWPEGGKAVGTDKITASLPASNAGLLAKGPAAQKRPVVAISQIRDFKAHGFHAYCTAQHVCQNGFNHANIYLHRYVPIGAHSGDLSTGKHIFTGSSVGDASAGWHHYGRYIRP